MKVYNVIYESHNIEVNDNRINVKTFLNKDNAIQYVKQRIQEIKEDLDEEDTEGYYIEETETYYERYLEGRAIEDSIAIWLEEHNTYDELV